MKHHLAATYGLSTLYYGLHSQPMTRFSTLLGTLVILFGGACITPAEVDFAEAEQELVVYSHFGVGESMKIYLTHTRDPLQPNQPFEPVEDATIKVYRDGELVSHLYHGDAPDKKVEYMALYDTEVLAIEGSHYQIEVMAEGYKNARSVETVPYRKASIINFEFVENTEAGKLYRLRFSDDESIENYYQLVIKELVRDMTDSIVSNEIVDYELVRSSAFTHFNNNTTWTTIYPDYAGFLFTGVHEEGGFKELFVEIPDEERTSTDETHSYRYKVELHNISDAYFLYHQSIYTQLTDNNPLNEPIGIYNNIENGFGNFSAYNAVITEADALPAGE